MKATFQSEDSCTISFRNPGSMMRSISAASVPRSCAARLKGMTTPQKSGTSGSARDSVRTASRSIGARPENEGPGKDSLSRSTEERTIGAITAGCLSTASFPRGEQNAEASTATSKGTRTLSRRPMS